MTPQKTDPLLLKEMSKTGSFYARLPSAFVYPVVERGKYIILCGAVLMCLLALAKWVSRLLPPHFFYVGIPIRILAGLIGLLFPAYILDVISYSAAGKDDPPDWPDFTNWLELLRPAFLIAGAVAISFLPAGLCRIALFYAWIENLALFWVLLILGVLYFPMALLAAVLCDGSRGFSPVLVVSSVVKTAPGYLVACVVLAAVLGVWFFVRPLLHAVPSGLGVLFSGMISLYLFMVEARILGLLYQTYEERLGWVC